MRRGLGIVKLAGSGCNGTVGDECQLSLRAHECGGQKAALCLRRLATCKTLAKLLLCFRRATVVVGVSEQKNAVVDVSVSA